MSYLIGVAGTPGAGKTSLVLGLARAIGDACAIHMDSYDNMTRLPLEAVAAWMRAGADIDAFAFPRLEQDLRRLKGGLAIIDPVSRREVGPRKYVLFETQFGRAHHQTGRHLDLVLWVDTPLDVALARTLRASIAGFLREREPARLEDRVRWLEGYIGGYLATVHSLLLMQRQRVGSSADVMVDGQEPLELAVRAARDAIVRRLP